MGPTKEEIAEAARLVRWRANPEKIRVSIRKLDLKWKATVTSLVTHKSLSCTSFLLEEAVMDVLEYAELENFDGIDLGLQWTYEHPWR